MRGFQTSFPGLGGGALLLMPVDQDGPVLSEKELLGLGRRL